MFEYLSVITRCNIVQETYMTELGR